VAGQQPPQPVQRGGEGAVGIEAVGVGPELVRQAADAGAAVTGGDQRTEQFQRPQRRATLEAKWRAVDQQVEAAEGVDDDAGPMGQCARSVRGHGRGSLMNWATV